MPIKPELRDMLVREYIKCAKDPVYFMKKYCYIQHPQRGRVMFNLYPFQEKVLTLFKDQENIIVLKSRQLGISTLAAGYSLWLMTFHKDKNILALATTQDTARNLVTKVVFMYDNLPKWMQLPATTKNKLSLTLSNGSRITAKSSSPNAARSEAVSLLLMDECQTSIPEQLTIRNKNTGEQRKVSFQELYERRVFQDLEVETPTGFKPFLGVKKTTKNHSILFTFEDRDTLRCSDSHKIKGEDGTFYYASMLWEGDKIYNGLQIKKREELEGEVDLYDFIGIEGSEYITEGKYVHHNCAFIDNAEETYTAAQQTLATGGASMLLSTPAGVGNWFHQMWEKAENGENTFLPVRLPWTVHPERDQTWRDKQEADLGKRMAAQECLTGDTRVFIKIPGSRPGVATLEDLYIFNQTVRGIEVKTPSGFQPFLGIKKTKKEEYLRIELETGVEVKCSLNHKFPVRGERIKAQTLRVGDKLGTETGEKLIVEIEKISEPAELYDLVEVGKDHLFYANGVISSNCDADFLTSGDTFFELEDILYMESTYAMDPLERRGVDGNLWIWQPADYTRSYMVSADVSRGDSEDYSAFHIIDLETCEQVGEYKGKISPKDFGNLLVGIGTEYNNALLVVENASIGWATIEQILERNYSNLYYSSRNKMDTVESYMRKYDREQLVPGFINSVQTRPLLTDKGQQYVREKGVIIHSKRTLSEMRAFIWKNGKPQSQPGYNDDLVMSLCIGLYVRDTALRMRQQGLDIARTQMYLLSTINTRNQLPVYNNTAPVNNPYQIRIGNGEVEDTTWVLG